MRRDLADDQHGQRRWRQHHLLQRAIGVILLEQAIERKHAGQQRRYPQDARSDPSEHFALGADTQWKQTDDHDKEAKRYQRV